MTTGKGQHGVGFAIKESILLVEKDGLAVKYQGVDLAGGEGWTGCGVHQYSTREGATKLEREI